MEGGELRDDGVVHEVERPRKLVQIPVPTAKKAREDEHERFPNAADARLLAGRELFRDAENLWRVIEHFFCPTTAWWVVDIHRPVNTRITHVHGWFERGR